MMKTTSALFMTGLLCLLSSLSFACQKGYTLQGGTGAYHKGGKCVPVTGKNLASSKTTTLEQKSVMPDRTQPDMKKTEVTRTESVTTNSAVSGNITTGKSGDDKPINSIHHLTTHTTPASNPASTIKRPASTVVKTTSNPLKSP